VFVDRHRVTYLTDHTPLIVLSDVAQSVDLPPLQTTSVASRRARVWVLSAGRHHVHRGWSGRRGLHARHRRRRQLTGRHRYGAWSAAVQAAGGAVVIAGPEAIGVTTLAEALARPASGAASFPPRDPVAHTTDCRSVFIGNSSTRLSASGRRGLDRLA